MFSFSKNIVNNNFDIIIIAFFTFSLCWNEEVSGAIPEINGFKTFKCSNADFEQILAVPTIQNEECFTNRDCLGAGITANSSETFDPYCVYNSTTHTSLCCFKSVGHLCNYGRPRFPLMKCANLQECNDRMESHNIGWCDDKWNVCCESDTETKPFCENSMYLRVAAENCDNCKGTCDEGRCCPPFKGTRNRIVLPDVPYETNIPCDPATPLLNNFQFGFCPTGNNNTKIWVLGKETLYGTKNIFVNLHCHSTNDCGQDGNDNWYVCVKQMRDYGKCYHNPLVKYVKTKSSLFWYYVLSLSTFFGILFGIIGIVADCMYQNGVFGDGYLTQSGAEVEPMMIAKD